MSSVKLCVLLVALATAVLAYPTIEPDVDEDFSHPTHDLRHNGDLVVFEHDVTTTDEPRKLSRAKRATCDLLSPFKVGHAACAANCLRQGFKGGWCDGKAVCNCRR